MTSRTGTWILAGMLFLLTTVPGRASAEASSADRAAARALFDQARALVAAGKFAEACTKLEESQRLEAGMGTLFNLADCYEKTGKTASAWTMFLDVASQAKSAGQAGKESVARERANALEPKLARLTIRVPSSAAFDGLEILRDGTVLGKGMWNTPLPVDPGDHQVQARGPRKKEWSTTVKVSESASESVEVRPLQDAAPETPGVPPSASVQPDAGKSGSGRKTAGLIVAGAGVIGLGVSGVLGLVAKGKVNDASSYCSDNVCNDMRGVDLRNDARSMANVATIVGAIGGVALVGGAVLFFTAPSASAAKTARASLSVSMGPSSVSLQGAW